MDGFEIVACEWVSYRDKMELLMNEQKPAEYQTCHTWVCMLLLRQYDGLLEEFSSPTAGSQALKFDTKYPKPFATQFRSVYNKYWAAYWRMPEYNGFRFFYAVSVGLLFGAIFWRLGYV